MSEHIQDVDPKVSTASKFFTRIYFAESTLAVMASVIVMQPSSPSGTFAIKIPIPNNTQSRNDWPLIK